MIGAVEHGPVADGPVHAQVHVQDAQQGAHPGANRHLAPATVPVQPGDSRERKDQMGGDGACRQMPQQQRRAREASCLAPDVIHARLTKWRA